MIKSVTTAVLTALLGLLLFAGCSKTKIEGVWTSTRTASSIEFNADKTGVIHQRAQATLPADLPFTWTMINKQEFTISVSVPGSPAPREGRGKLEGNMLILENDTFTRTR